MIQKIAIIGAGRIGKAIHYLLDVYKGETVLWDIDESLLDDMTTLKESVQGAQVVFLAIPSWSLREGLKNILPYMTTRALFVPLTKGLEPQTHMTADAVLAHVLGRNHDYALLSGPMMAEEIMRDFRAGAVVASHNTETFDVIKELFSGSKLYLEFSQKTHAVALAAVLKNVYSLGFGIVDGLGLSGNEKGMVFPHMLKEQMRIQELLGGHPEKTLGLAGLGDIICTGFSPFSRQRTTGEQLIQHGKINKQSESVSSLPSLVAMLGDNIQELPLLQAIVAIILDGQKAEGVIDTYFLNL